MTQTVARDEALAEFFGTALLLTAVVGSGIMGENLAQGNAGLALLANSLATGAALYVLITALAPVSGAHFNPAVSLCFAVLGKMAWERLPIYLALQFSGAVLGVVAANLMFDMPTISLSTTERSGAHLLLSEFIATCGLLLTIILFVKHKPDAVPLGVALFITGAYWFTSSTSFANPAVSFARIFSDSFTGIAAHCAPAFIAVQTFAAFFIGLGVVFRNKNDARKAQELV
jgi:glycerol uptake facilitator-like aquaporin